MNVQEAQQAAFGLYNAHRDEIYFTWLAERSRRYKLLVNVLTLLGTLAAAFFAGVGVVGTTAAVELLWWAMGAGLVAAFTTVVGVIFDFSARSIRASELAKEVGMLGAEWRKVLIQYSYGEGDKYTVGELERRHKQIEAPVSSELPHIRRLNLKAAKLAEVRYKEFIVNGEGKREQEYTTKTTDEDASAEEKLPFFPSKKK